MYIIKIFLQQNFFTKKNNINLVGYFTKNLNSLAISSPQNQQA